MPDLHTKEPTLRAASHVGCVKIWGCKKSHTTPYHPNGSIEHCKTCWEHSIITRRETGKVILHHWYTHIYNELSAVIIICCSLVLGQVVLIASVYLSLCLMHFS